MAREEATETRSAASTPAIVAPSSVELEPIGPGSGATVASESTRKDGVAAVIRGVLHDLSGIEVGSLDDHATFLTLGLDSLLLTQAGLAFQRKLGVRVTFRQFFEDAPTIDTLAAYIDDELPEGALQPQRQTSEASDSNASPPEQPPLLGDARGRAGKGHGPWQPVDTRAGTLDGRQQRHLDRLIDRLNQRTPKSKALTQANRAHLADARTVAGFRLPWKELVYPIVVERSAGSRVWDVDGNEFLDIAMGFGVSLFGHAPRFVTEAVHAQLAHGYEIGPQTALAGEVAALISELTGMERVAFCNTGSEAVLAALRMARTVTGCTKVATFAGDYHGIFDEMLGRRVGSGPQQKTVPIAPGISPRMVEDVLMLDYGEEASLERIREHAHELAAVIVEPVQSRHPDLQPVEFLRALRDITTELDIPLIFDEMITGFRCHPGGVQALYGVRADIATYGKVIGGGFPIGVVAGHRRFLDALDGGMWQYGDESMPETGVTWFAGTFARHPVALAAARATLRHLKSRGPELQTQLNARTSAFVDDLNGFLTERGAPIRIEHFSSLFLVRFLSHRDYASLFYFQLRDQGIHVTEGRAAFLSTAHTDADLDHLRHAFKESVRQMEDGGFFPARRVAVPAERDRTIRTTEPQQEIWRATQLGPEASNAFNLSNTLSISGPLDVDRMRAAIQDLVDRHEALRTTFDASGDTQHVAPNLCIDVPLSDLTELEPTTREERLASAREREVTTAFDLLDGPLVRAHLIRMAEEQHHLFLTVHHIVCDGWSSGVLLRELASLYSRSATGRPPALPAPMQLTEFVDWH